ncbi:hypothetical protein [Mesorhizobium sp. BE184]|uniref:hypothetical protein n=1 Tax=Mesorhizobium sp. BE184 TaxID=2817714 RepID=UPI002861D825|nr:hypothetical protein [Mesorhizobium sp. BE184]MDR7034495.1 hypothetical protein [Mesorhizobium sp. BE184]
MSSPETFDIVVAQLGDNWTLTPVVFENEDYQLPDTPAPFVSVEIYGDFFDQASIGAGERDDNLWREGGEIFLHVMTPNGTGSRQARQYAKQLVNLFRGQDIDGVRFLDASIGAGDPGRSFSNYYAMTATIGFERDE